MNPDVTLKSAKRIFADTMEKMMQAHGIDFGPCTDKQVKVTIAECTSEFDVIYADLMQWVNYGDDEREKTLNVIRTSLQVASMWG